MPRTLVAHRWCLFGSGVRRAQVPEEGFNVRCVHLISAAYERLPIAAFAQLWGVVPLLVERPSVFASQVSMSGASAKLPVSLGLQLHLA